ncbi:hypothetical protein SIL08_11625 [Scandinavium sp. V105_16]|uniref:Uncharacterized protein n=1 Tax=Scandinavium lactucae TaxID=3095028 RepID=A0AAJ2VY79_9ENTR|nr:MULTISPECIES: hypothetical protein [unclassified Scandinavium]MDX6020920.1 hypothetical protein [Scandinavium sp. V105_16]MDX6032543.1 hypothetical protein [Scandinavium sp. V105_12]
MKEEGDDENRAVNSDFVLVLLYTVEYPSASKVTTSVKFLFLAILLIKYSAQSLFDGAALFLLQSDHFRLHINKIIFKFLFGVICRAGRCCWCFVLLMALFFYAHFMTIYAA